MKFMERRGSGLSKIITETEKLPGYTENYKPQFVSSATEFKVVLKNVNYKNVGVDSNAKNITKTADKKRPIKTADKIEIIVE